MRLGLNAANGLGQSAVAGQISENFAIAKAGHSGQGWRIAGSQKALRFFNQAGVNHLLNPPIGAGVEGRTWSGQAKLQNAIGRRIGTFQFYLWRTGDQEDLQRPQDASGILPVDDGSRGRIQGLQPLEECSYTVLSQI